jgi:hypothetical protein
VFLQLKNFLLGRSSRKIIEGSSRVHALSIAGGFNKLFARIHPVMYAWPAEAASRICASQHNSGDSFRLPPYRSSKATWIQIVMTSRLARQTQVIDQEK